jgi:hypothetical protein
MPANVASRRTVCGRGESRKMEDGLDRKTWHTPPRIGADRFHHFNDDK